jgi:hypothetical protein
MLHNNLKYNFKLFFASLIVKRGIEEGMGLREALLPLEETYGFLYKIIL